MNKTEKIINLLDINKIKYEKVRSYNATIISFLNKNGWEIYITIPNNSDTFTVDKSIQISFDSDKITDILNVL